MVASPLSTRWMEQFLHPAPDDATPSRAATEWNKRNSSQRKGQQENDFKYCAIFVDRLVKFRAKWNLASMTGPLLLSIQVQYTYKTIKISIIKIFFGHYCVLFISVFWKFPNMLFIIKRYLRMLNNMFVSFLTTKLWRQQEQSGGQMMKDSRCTWS